MRFSDWDPNRDLFRNPRQDPPEVVAENRRVAELRLKARNEIFETGHSQIVDLRPISAIEAERKRNAEERRKVPQLCGPRRDTPRDWIVWHFTHVDNLPSIINQGRLLPDSEVTPAMHVANDEVKERRRHKGVSPDAAYPTSMASDHVPFYIAAKSPMLFVVCRGYGHYIGGAGPLVHLGVGLGDIVDAGLTWCASDGNAAATFTQFSRDLPGLGDFVDFDLLCQRDWYNTPDDGDRKSRRSAEILVLGAVPIELVSFVCCARPETMDTVRALLEPVGGMRNYRVQPQMYY